MSVDIPLGLYVHIPWCLKKCPYCDFNSHALKNSIPEQQYIQALLVDLQLDVQRFNETRKLSHIFIGGGTPSLFSAEAIASLLEGIGNIIVLEDDLEITLEANPGTFESGKFAAFRAAGVNRLSIGIQSFNDTHLRRLGRVHSAAEAMRAAEIARQSGFENFNLDLMFGLPGQTAEHSEQDVKLAIDQQPTHISFYQLTLEPNTLFHKYPPRLPPENDIIASQNNCKQHLAEHCFYQYEVSAFRKPGYACRHNMNYWTFGDYLGIGCGAHGKISQSLPDRIFRYAKPKSPDQYLKKLANKALFVENSQVLESELPLEFLMNHLRLKAGFTEAAFINRTGLYTQSLEPALSNCLEERLMIHNKGHYQCTEQGWNFLDSILEKFMF